jgi:hypothetical protein
MATLAIPKFRDEGSGGNAGASRTRSGKIPEFAPDALQAPELERSATPEISFRRAPDSNFESGFCFFSESK